MLATVPVVKLCQLLLILIILLNYFVAGVFSKSSLFKHKKMCVQNFNNASSLDTVF